MLRPVGLYDVFLQDGESWGKASALCRTAEFKGEQAGGRICEGIMRSENLPLQGGVGGVWKKGREER
jgi:hypothetical protein